MATPFHHLHYYYLLLSLSLLFSLSSSTPTPTIIHEACKATQYPLLCQSSLSPLNQNNNHQNPTIISIISTTLSLSSSHLSTALSLSSTLHSSSPSHNLSLSSQTCLDLLSLSSHRLPRVNHNDFTLNLKHSRAWLSAALTYQYDCLSELSYTNVTTLVAKTMSFLNTTLIPTTSNALSMLVSLDLHGDDVTHWSPPQTERAGFYEPTQPGPNNHLRFEERESFKPEREKANVVVCKEGKARGCNYVKIQEAVDHAPKGLNGKQRFVIYVKQGVYEEIVRVPFEVTNLVLLGDGIGKTVITGSVNTGIMGISTYNTATVGVKGDGFMASGITFQNTAGPNAHQAVAFRSDSDFSLVENCEFLSNQDTLYAHSLRQVYRSCHIEGNVDFIFGNAAALFQDCTILVRPRQLDPAKGENNAITAQGRTDPAESTGFVFLGCHISGTDEYMKLWRANPKVHKNYLGRPWKMYSRTMFIGCTMEGLISPEGWMPFRDDFALSTLYYGEFQNKGPGADMSKRVNWSSRIPKGHLSAYSARNFIQADEWKSIL